MFYLNQKTKHKNKTNKILFDKLKRNDYICINKLITEDICKNRFGIARATVFCFIKVGCKTISRVKNHFALPP